jgi:multiple sugar transport system substrate-binding protein
MNTRRMNRREMLKVSALAAAGTLLAACAPKTVAPEATSVPVEATVVPVVPASAVKISFMMWAWSPENEKFERDRVDMFNKSQQAVVVEPIILPYEDLWTKLTILVASGEAPDSVWYDYAAFPLIAKGEFRDLKDYVVVVPDFTDDKVYDQNFWPPAKMLGDERMIALPIGGEGMNLFYNKNLLDESSVAYPTDDLTWDQFLVMAQQLTKTEGDQTTQFGTSLATLKAWWAWPLVLQSRGVDIVDSRTRLKYKVAPDLAQSSVLNDQGGDFGSGKVATYIDGAWDIVGFRGIDRFKWDIGLLPKGPKGRPSPFWIGGPMVSKQSKNPDQSWAWAKWTAGKDGEELIASSGQQVTWLRSAREILPEGAKPEHYSKRFETLQEIIPGDVWSAQWNQVLDKVWNPEFDKFWQGQITAEQLVATIVPATDKLLQEPSS